MSSNSSIESILKSEGFYLFAGNGFSMWPLIREGIDTVEVQPVSTPLKPGDVILFRAEDRYVLHRIIKSENGVLTVRGDNNSGCETLAEDCVAGIMTGLWRQEKKVRLKSLRYALYTALCLKHPRLFRLLKSKLYRK